MEEPHSIWILRVFFLVIIGLTLNMQFILIRIFTLVIILLALLELLMFTSKIYGEIIDISREVKSGRYYIFQISNNKIKWYRRLIKYINIVIWGKSNDEISEKVILKKYVSKPMYSYLFYTFFLSLEIMGYLMPVLDKYFITIMLFFSVFILISFFMFLMYLYFPVLTMLVLPLIGVLSCDLIRELNLKLRFLSSYDKSFYMALVVMVFSVVFAWIISTISPMYLLQKISGVSGALQILFVSLVGTFIIKYGFPVLFFHMFPSMDPDYVSNELIKAGQKLDFAGSNDIKSLFIDLLKYDLLKKNADEFQQIEGYFSDYLLIAGADFTINTMVMKHKQKRAMNLIKQTPISNMSYNQLKELMVTGGDSVEMAIWNNQNAKKVILENQQEL